MNKVDFESKRDTFSLGSPMTPLVFPIELNLLNLSMDAPVIGFPLEEHTKNANNFHKFRKREMN